MSLPEQLRELEARIAEAVGQALEEARRSLGQEMRRRSDEWLRSLEQVQAPSATFLTEADLAPITSSTRREGLQEGFEILRRAVSRLDGTHDQATTLATFLEEAGHFASRTALLLTFPEGARGWATFGFPSGSKAADLTVPYDPGTWAEVGRGRGWVELDSADCGPLCEYLEAELPERAVLVPMVLRDRVAAVLYADQLDPDDQLLPDALELLTYAAAQILELQGLRERATTPTLHPAAEVEGEGLPLWDLERESAAVAPVPEVAAEAEEAEEELAVVEPPVEAEVPTEETAAALEAAEEVAGEELFEAAEPEAGEAAEELPAWQVEPVEQVPEVEEPPVAEAPPEEPALEVEPEGVPWSYEEAPPETEEAAVTSEIEVEEVEEEAEAVAEEEVVAEPPAESLDATIRVSREALTEYAQQPAEVAPEEAGVEVEEPEVEEPPPLPAEEEEEPVEAEPIAEPDISEDETVLIQRPDLAPPPAEPEPGRTSPAGGPVAPPPDLQGPGWAFRAGRAEEEGEEATDTLHEEARRLARLLVSEIKLYNEEQVDEGRRHRDIYRRLREDIDRSRQMYEERVDERVREEVDYFYQELVAILAAGEAEALGI
jgi:hypothetical protein